MPTRGLSERGGDSALVERSGEIEQVTAAVAAAAGGAGRSLLIEGLPGVGKTAMADLAAARAADRGMTVARATGAALEQDLSWGVVRSALGSELASADRRTHLLQGAAAAAAPLFTGADTPPEGARVPAVLHGLYWLVSDLAAERPLALIIDDAHWADGPSARWLAYLAARLTDLPLLLVLTARPEPATRWWRAVAASPAAAVMTLRPLSRAGTHTLVTERLGPGIPDGVADACHETTGGNPFLLGELLRHVRQHEHEAPSTPEHIRALRPDSIRRSVLLRLSQLGTEAIELCFAVAVLGQSATLPLAAELAGIEPPAAAALAASLEAADVIRATPRIEFIHPLVLDVITREIPAARRGTLHLAAAELLEQRGAPPGVRAPHLLATEPNGRPEVVHTLRAAAAEAFSVGAPEVATACLLRALDEPPPEAELVGVLTELGRAEGMVGEPAGADHLRDALKRSGDVVERARITRELTLQLLNRGEITEAVALSEAAAANLPESERELRLQLLAHVRTAASQDFHAPPDSPDGVDPAALTGATAGERAVLAALANLQTRTTEAPIARAYVFAERALQGTALLDDVGADSPQFWNAAMVTLFAEHYEETESLISAAIEDARRRGSPRGYGLCLTFGSPVHFRLGRLREAAEDARRAAEMFTGEPLVRAHALSFLIEALIDLGALREARELAGGDEFTGATSVSAYVRVRGCVARLRRLEGDAAGAAADLVQIGMAHAGASPVLFPWRAEAALAFHAAGNDEQAHRFAQDSLAAAEIVDSRWVLARSLHAVAVVENSLEPLRRAEDLTRDQPIRLERARVLVELGAGLRRRGETRAAMDHLREGLDLADRCGAVPLAVRARDELRAAGARPRRARSSGPDALTASELRVARMAARGASNREIGQALFVSLRTVETHLTRSYVKLGISGRSGLSAALEASAGRAGG